MNEKKLKQPMQGTIKEPACARAEDLVAYLYGEASAAEARSFESHMQGCAVCRAELSEFRQLRSAIGEWKEESLGSILAPASEPNLAPMFNGMKASNVRRSALAAVREFFTLAPNWMRAATAMAGLLVCALAIIALSHLNERPQVASVNKPVQQETASPKGYTQEELEAVVQQRIKEHDAEKQTQQAEPENAIIRIARNQQPRSPVGRNRTAETNTLAAKLNSQPGPRSISNRERQELAEVLLQQTATIRDEENLPELSDLLGDSDDPN